MPIVQMPDGALVDMPDNPTPEQMAALQKLTAPQQAPQQTPPPAGLPSGSEVLSGLKQVGSGLVEGLTSIPRMLAEGGAAFQSTQSAFPSRRKEDNFSQMSTDLKEALPASSGDMEKYVRSISEGIGGGLTGPGSLGLKLASGASSGLAAEVGERVAGQPGRMIGGVVGGAAPGSIPGLFKGNTAQLAKRGLDGITDDELQAAAVKMRDAAAAGTPITLGQALGRGTNVDSLETALANSEHGRKIQDLLRAQPGQLAQAGAKQVERLPGEIVQPNDAANNMQDAATSALAQAKAHRTRTVDKFYKDGGEIPENMVTSIQMLVRKRAEQYPNTALGDALNNLAERMAVKGGQARNIVSGSSGKPLVDPSGKQLKIEDADKPITDLQQFNEVLKQVYRDVKAPGLNKAPVDAFQDKVLRETLDGIRDDLGALFPKFKAGNQLYKSLSETIVDPLKKSPTGQIAGRTGAQEDKAAARSLADSIFKQGTTPGGSSNILKVERDLRQAGKQSDFLSAAKSHLTRVLGTIVQEGPGGQLSPDLATNVQKVFGNAVQRQGLKDTLVGMARAQGLRDTDLLPGFENFLKIAALQAKRPSSIRGMNPQEIAQEAGSNVASNTARVASFMPAEKLARSIERRYEGAAMESLDRMLTSPEGVKQLQKLGRLPVMSREAQAIVQGLLGGLVQSNNP